MTKTIKILIAIILLASFLRLWRLDDVPVSLFGDELDVGYQAYSILKTGKDYSGNFLPLHFQSLAEWRTPLYLYSVVPTVAIFGISPWGVRLPAAIFGILGIWIFYLLIRQVTKKEGIALLAAFLLTISPWHIQYSRAGFEVTQMLALFLAGIYFFLRALEAAKNKKSPTLPLTLAGVFLALTPYVYSTAKLFLPLTVLALIIIWFKDILKLPRKSLVTAGIVSAIIIMPIVHSTLFGGGTARFDYISVFSDPTMSPEIGFERLLDAQVRTPEAQIGIQPTVIDRAFHNKITWLADILGRNYLQSFSTQFLFINGDLNPRHSIPNVGQFYRFEAIFILIGIFFFFAKQFDRKIKAFLIFWLLASIIPASLTRDGGMHATRLFFMLPPLIFLLSLGAYYTFEFLKGMRQKLFVAGYVLVLVASVIFYQHEYWVHYPWESERWWHAGFEESIKTIKSIDHDYDKVIISTASEPPWIFFAGWYEFSPTKWHEGYPFQKTILPGFGEISYIDKFYFGSPASVYGLSPYIDDKTLYLSTAKEVGTNLILEKDKGVDGLTLIKAIAYPSGEPAYYLFSGTSSSGE